MPPNDPVARLETICQDVGFDLRFAKQSLLDRVRLLAAHSQTIEDARRMAGHARRVFQWFRENDPAHAFSELEQRTVILGALLSDIGKTGPEHASATEQRLVVEMFAVEGVPHDTIRVEEFFATYFPADAEERIARFRGMGLDPTMTIRQFWNLHSGWTLAIAEAAGVPAEAVAAAATHHYFDDVNPEDIVREDGRFSRDFGQNVQFDRPEKLIIVLDKYDALRRRGHRTHDEAIAWLKERLVNHPRARDDHELGPLVAAVDAVLG